MIVKQLTWTFMLTYCRWLSFIVRVFAWFFPSDHEIHCTHSKFVKNVISSIIRILFCAFSGTHLDIIKFKVLLRTSIYNKGNGSVREFGCQDTTPKFSGLIPENVCLPDEDIWWSLYLCNNIVQCLSNNPLLILKNINLS